jgi:outer membrane protein with beta-barrel domain
MRRSCSFLLALAVLVPAAAQAQWTIGARTGYAIPLGDADGSAAMSDITTGQIPLQLDIGYRLPNTALTLGGYVSYGFGSAAGLTKDACDFAGESCSTSTFRIGAQLLYSLAQPNQTTLPWIGVGLGYDSLKLSASGGDVTTSGIEFILQGGLDWRLSPQFTLGGFASLSFGQYNDISDSTGTSGSITDKRTHEWLTIGIRGAFGFGGY